MNFPSEIVTLREVSVGGAITRGISLIGLDIGAALGRVILVLNTIIPGVLLKVR